jgi:hypothetical protein
MYNDRSHGSSLVRPILAPQGVFSYEPRMSRPMSLFEYMLSIQGFDRQTSCQFRPVPRRRIAEVQCCVDENDKKVRLPPFSSIWARSSALRLNPCAQQSTLVSSRILSLLPFLGALESKVRGSHPVWVELSSNVALRPEPVAEVRGKRIQRLNSAGSAQGAARVVNCSPAFCSRVVLHVRLPGQYQEGQSGM